MVSQKFVLYFKLTVIAACMSFLALLCVPFTTTDGGGMSKVFVYIVAGTFWGGLILEQVFLKGCRRERQLAERRRIRRRKRKENVSQKKKLFQNREAKIIAGVFVMATLAIVLLIFFQVQSTWAVILSVGVFFLSFNLYFVFNGRNFQYMKLYKGEE